MDMITIETSGSFKKTEDFLSKMSKLNFESLLDRYGAMGVSVLASVTPRDSGLTAGSWNYEVVKEKGRYSIVWHNTNVVSGIPVAILIQYGHATRNGTWIEGYDYINPVIKPMFDRIADEVWKQVTNG
jgi:hypothetical protein